MHLETAQITAIGGRKTNQDALASAHEDGLSCFVVSDGTGGHQGGEVAAQLVTEGIIEKFRQEASFSARALRSYVDWAILKVAQNKLGNVKQENMSATMATLLIDQSNHSALWAHLGDTRIYMFRDGKIRTISKDHSQTQRLVDAGYVEYAQIRQQPQRSVLFAAIGAEGETSPEVTMEATQLQDGDAFLVCTDGFWEWVHEHEMEQSLALTHSSEAWLDEMNMIARHNIGASESSRDNFSAFTICVHGALAPR
jgi:serine/threonine protein phosphatase PrpC